ncbi:1-acyl-sn-glycerol-3-phosphate acyltransferase [Pseudooceanicola sediminis]|uniref:1-acyl-sn-glycerol-3-phosphate acyltransferase n=1 Tax=Pseudooceanicola sediminis TaxID=2211117 RepID=A0A399J2G9_9RHOB|nr:lysophospholipid acyltransferase family protein [Pseudooceanicola sediminis]RII39421.1 1-acyl-sn-glycerol-3-phosphate acyltransferase [Pseudooceanicola sediminis]
MMIALHYVRSVIFIVQMYLAMLVAGAVFLPWAVVSRQGAYSAVRFYSRYVRWSLRLICGLQSEVRGTVPTGEVVIASKHQSFLDIIMIVSVVDRPKFIMKNSLRYMPILGWYALRIGCVSVRRGHRAEAIHAMMDAVHDGNAPAGQLIIFPQGTRVAPGAVLPYKVGALVIYEETGQSCVPVAANVGLFWPRQGMLRRPGLAIIEFLAPIPPGLDRARFRATLEQVIESRSNALMLEGGFAANELSAIDRGA